MTTKKQQAPSVKGGFVPPIVAEIFHALNAAGYTVHFLDNRPESKTIVATRANNGGQLEWQVTVTP
jgi:hypothetical protein